MKANLTLFLFLISFSVSLTIQGQIIFEESAQQLGINHTYQFGQAGGGISFVDFDGDGLDDLTLATPAGELIHFYRNNGNGFSRNPPLIGDMGEHKQILWADYDNDGDKDLFICVKSGVNRLYQNNGNLALVEITENAGLPLHTFDTFNACWADFNRDGWLDLYVCERIALNQPMNRNYLFFNNADGTFTDVSETSNALAGQKLPFSSSALDYNNDMWPDIYIANDRERGNVLLSNGGQGDFSDLSIATKSDYEMDGMSVALGDYDKDGDTDIYISNSPKGNILAQNNLDSFQNVSEPLGIEYGGTAWGANFLDADNDGKLDLYVSGSDLGSDKISSAFYHQITKDSFTLIIDGFIADTVISYANAIGDHNDDGRPDIGVLNYSGYKSFLFVNESISGHYIKLELEGIVSNRDAVGSFIELFHDTSYQTYYTHSGIGFLGQNSDDVLFGIGASPFIDSLIIHWPSGHIDKLKEFEADTSLHIQEGMSTAGIINISDDVTILENNFPSSINHIEEQDSYSIYPNPFKAEFNIYDDKGENVSRFSIFSPSGEKVQLSSNLPAGVYFLKILTDDDQLVVKKVIKTQY